MVYRIEIFVIRSGGGRMGRKKMELLSMLDPRKDR